MQLCQFKISVCDTRYDYNLMGISFDSMKFPIEDAAYSLTYRDQDRINLPLLKTYVVSLS